jgi:hypothetical protein
MKTAGTSFDVILDQQFPSRKICSSYTIDAGTFLSSFANLSAEQRTSFDLIRGHNWFGLHELVPRPCVYVTFVRNPIERVLSYYYHIKRDRKHPYHKDFHDIDLEAFVSGQWAAHDEVTNIQTRFLSGEIGETRNDERILTKAKANLESHFPVVGVVERFDESIILIRRTLGWRWHACFYPRLNTTPGRPREDQSDPRVLAIIREKNSLDIALYEYCLERLSRQIAAEGGFFPIDLEIFTKLNRLAAPLVLAKAQHLWPRVKTERKIA